MNKTYDEYLDLLITTKYGAEMKDAIRHLFLINQQRISELVLKLYTAYP